MERRTARVHVDLTSRDTKRRESAVRRLCEKIWAGDTDMIEFLQELARDDPSVNIRFYVRHCLRSLESHPSMTGARREPIRDPLSPEAVRAALVGDDPTRKVAILEALEDSSDKGYGDQIEEYLGTETDPWLLSRMVSALAAVGDARHGATVRGLLRHPDVRVCVNSIETLVALSGDRVVASLLPLLVREDNRLQANLMVALYHSYEPQVLGFVRRMLRSEKIAIRTSGLSCARYTDAAQIYPDVLALLQLETEEPVLSEALRWMGDFAPLERARRDLSALAESRPERADAIQEALGHIESETGTETVATNRPETGPRLVETSSGRLQVGPRRPPEGNQPMDPGAGSRLADTLTKLGERLDPLHRAVREDRRVAGSLLGAGALLLVLVAWPTSEEVPDRPVRKTARTRSARTLNRDLRVLVTEVDPGGTQLSVSVMGSIYPLALPAPLEPPPTRGTTLIVSGARLFRDENGLRRLQARTVTLK